MAFVVCLIFGVICALIASSRGRSPVGWFFIGFFTHIIGLILVLVLQNLQTVRAKENYLYAENRRLREKIKKERQVSDLRHQEAVSRLSAHDRALGIDTGNLPGVLSSPPPVPIAAIEDLRTARWYYVVDYDERVGPVDFATLRELWRQGEIDAETLVWRNGQADWVQVRDRMDLEAALDA